MLYSPVISHSSMKAHQYVHKLRKLYSFSVPGICEKILITPKQYLEYEEGKRAITKKFLHKLFDQVYEEPYHTRRENIINSLEPFRTLLDERIREERERVKDRKLLTVQEVETVESMLPHPTDLDKSDKNNSRQKPKDTLYNVINFTHETTTTY